MRPSRALCPYGTPGEYFHRSRQEFQEFRDESESGAHSRYEKAGEGTYSGMADGSRVGMNSGKFSVKGEYIRVVRIVMLEILLSYCTFCFCTPGEDAEGIPDW